MYLFDLAYILGVRHKHCAAHGTAALTVPVWQFTLAAGTYYLASTWWPAHETMLSGPILSDRDDVTDDNEVVDHDGEKDTASTEKRIGSEKGGRAGRMPELTTR